MKKLIFGLLALLPILACGQQGLSIRATNGFGINLTAYTNLFVPDVLTATNVIKIPPILPTATGAGNFEVLAHIPGNTTFYKSTGLIIEDTTKVLIGNGAGLTNLTASAGLQTPWLRNIDSAGFNLTNIGGILIGAANGSATVLASGSTNLYALARQAYEGSTFISSSNVFVIGYQPMDNAVAEGSRVLVGIGYNPFSNSFITNSLHLYAMGDSPFDGAVISGSSEIFGLGYQALSGATISGSDSIFFLGLGVGASVLLIDGSEHIFVNGYDILSSAANIVSSADIFADGISILAGAQITNSSHLIFSGFNAGRLAIIVDSEAIFANGENAFEDAIIVNGSQELYGLSKNAFNSAMIDGSSSIYGFGYGAFQSATLTNSSALYAFGESAGVGLSGTFNNLFLIGSGDPPTGDGQLVVGNIYKSIFQSGIAASTNNFFVGTTNAGQFRNDGDVNWTGVASGDGSGITNLTGATFPAGPTYVFHGKVTFNSNVVFNSQLIANGQDITNVYEKNVSVTTNGFGVSLIDFSLGTQVDTNMSGNLTLTGISNFNTTNLNWQVVSLNPNGADRVITIPSAWLESGFTNATTVTLATTNWGELRVRCQVGRYTNASFEIFYQ